MIPHLGHVIVVVIADVVAGAVTVDVTVGIGAATVIAWCLATGTGIV